MTINETEVIKNQASALNVSIEIIHYDVNRFSVQVGKHSYSNMNNALSAITTSFLKGKK